MESRLRTILPPDYQDAYEEMQPVPMRSAPLKYAADGTVAWDEIWGSFCDLAMAGGPPHKGSLLQAGSPGDIAAQPERQAEVVAEICRGITLVTDLAAAPGPVPGWARVTCLNHGMAKWLLRAITMENVAVRGNGASLDLPAAPHFRLEREIKNVITVIAKTCHYWIGHMPPEQQLAIRRLLDDMDDGSPLIVPADGDRDVRECEMLATAMAQTIQAAAGLPRATQGSDGWLGLECPTVRSALWMMRAHVANNILSRREGTALFVPVNPVSDPGGAIVVRSAIRIRALASARGVL